MKFQKLLLSAATVCLLSVAPDAAMARNDCPSGTITGGTYTAIVINEFASCLIVGAVIGSGGVIVTNADQFTMKSSVVSGHVRVTNTVSAFLADNQVQDANLVATGNLFSNVVRNYVVGGDIRVNDNTCEQQQEVAVLQNVIVVGSLRVNCNEKADVAENKVRDGDITCRDNDRLDSRDNDAFGGKVNCSRSLFN